jgi:hypothetical protein
VTAWIAYPQKAQNAFHEQLEELYECKECKSWQSGCDPVITSDGFTAGDCTKYGPFLMDCDDDGVDEWFQGILCTSTMYDWTYHCTECVDND